MELINETIGQCLKRLAERDGTRTALEVGNRRFTFGETDRITDSMAVEMDKLGISRGTHVGIWSVNSISWVFTFLALVKIGAVPVLINTCCRQEEVKGILNYSDTEVLYYGTGYRTAVYQDILDEIRPGIPKVRHMIPLKTYGSGGQGRQIPYTDSGQITNMKNKVMPSDPACMIFTSGTTALPKGVLLSHYNLVNNAQALVENMRWKPEDKMCITVPLFHCFGITAGIVSCVMGGMSMHLIPYFKTANVWDAIEKSQCTILNGVPSMFLALIRRQEYISRDGSKLTSGIIAGSPMMQGEYMEICGRFPNMHLQPSYGQTETSPCVTIAGWDEPKEKKAGSAGKTIEHVEVRIAELKTGSILGTGQDGEVQVRGYNMMSGYYNLPEANSQAFTGDGWLKTGDIGRLDGEGELYITGRLKEMIIRAGENISPQEIEMAIRRLEWVRDVKVIGIPAEVLQEEIVACVIPKPGVHLDEAELFNFLQQRLAHYKIPAYSLEFQAFPLNASGKISLKTLKELALAQLMQKTSETKKCNKRRI